jgi:hypothetical protein
VLGLGLLACGAASGAAQRHPRRLAPASRPNIVWIMADDSGYADTGITGAAQPHAKHRPNQDWPSQSYANSSLLGHASL